jgi:ABC-type branched-subunit amino acid transport system ATPase component
VVDFGLVRVLDGFELSIAKGTIHGLIGPNGAGKTTLVNALTAVIKAGAGEILLDGQPLPSSPRAVALAGIGRTFQSSTLSPELSALDNVLVGGVSKTRSGVLRSALQTPLARREHAQLRARAAALLDEVGAHFERTAPVSELPFGALRKVEIARALMLDPMLLILDEPTAGMTSGEVDEIRQLLVRLRDGARGVTALLIEHNMDFVFGCCDVVTAMDNGRAIASGAPGEIRRDPEVIRSYLGVGMAEQDDMALAPTPSASPNDRPTLLSVQNLTAGYGGAAAISSISIEVSEKDFVAIFGANGAGKSTLLNALFGQPAPSHGKVVWRGKDITGKSAEVVVKRGLVLVPQDGSVFPDQTVDDNLQLALHGVGLRRSEARARRASMYELFPGLSKRSKLVAGLLSGGERRMLSLAKALIRQPKLIALDEPSIGLSPSVVQELKSKLQHLKLGGLTVIVSEQNASWVLPLATDIRLLTLGHMEQIDAESVIRDPRLLVSRYLGAGTAGEDDVSND